MATKKVPASNRKTFVKYNVRCSEEYGRYLVARKEIDAGEIIIRENPVVIGPGICTDNNKHSCFECLRIIPTYSEICDSNILCSNCQVAIFCCVACEARKFHHTIEECKILKKKKNSFRVENIVLPLRLWLIKKKDKELWEKILRLEAHLEARRDTYIWEHRERNVINVLKTLGIVNKSEGKNFSELLQRICGILDVNSFELPLPGSIKDSASWGLYLEASLMVHNCQGNTFANIDEDFQLTIRASKPIDNGEIIFFNYTTPILGMAERRKILREGKYFECNCPMCEDPYELGTNLSTMFCPYCNIGLITFASKTTKNPYVEEKNWKCNKCQTSLSGYLIAFYLYLVKMRIASVENTIEESEILLKKLSSTFHPNHFLMLKIKRRLFRLYKIGIDDLNSSQRQLTRIVEIGTKILDILDIVEPGISCLKGAFLYYISRAILYLSNRVYSTRKMTFDEYKEQLEKIEKSLKKSVIMLLYSPPTTPEGIFGKRVLQEYKVFCQRQK